jgi:hypothetical protein
VIAVSLRFMAGLTGALALVVVLEWAVPEGGGGAQAPSAFRLAHSAPKVTLQARAVTQWANVVLARPLFFISRRPPRIEVSGHNDAAPAEARLSGILIGRFGRRAIFAPEGGGKPLVLAEGASINESTIRSIAPGQVTLASGAVLKPEFDKNRAPSTPYIPPFQPTVPNFPAPGFVNGQIQQPNFPVPRMPVPVSPQPDSDNGQAGEANTPAQPVPMFRGPMGAQRRE